MRWAADVISSKHFYAVHFNVTLESDDPENGTGFMAIRSQIDDTWLVEEMEEI